MPETKNIKRHLPLSFMMTFVQSESSLAHIPLMVTLTIHIIIEHLYNYEYNKMLGKTSIFITDRA